MGCCCCCVKNLNQPEQQSTKKIANHTNSHNDLHSSARIAEQQQQNKGHKYTQAELKKILDDFFDKYDINEDGVLNKFELRHLIEDFYANVDSSYLVTKEQIRAIQQSVEDDDDHVVTREEFYHFFKRR